VTTMTSMASGKDHDEESPSAEQEVVNKLVEAGFVKDLFAKIEPGDLQLSGPGGLIPALLKAALEAGLQVELADHLGYDKGDPAGRGAPNVRNGSTPKTVLSEAGPVGLDVPRDRLGSFEPRLVPKGSRRLGGGLDDMIISLYAGGMTARDIEDHLARTMGVEVSRETISKITDAVLEEVKAWQTRPLDEVYPILYLDALVVKIRDGAHVINKAAHIAVGVDLTGVKHVLGIWVAASEGASFWASVIAELANRGVKDVIVACVDGLTGFAEAVETTFPKATVQTCVVHLIRASMRFVAYGDRKPMAKAMRAVYTAANADAAQLELLALAETDLGRRYPAALAVWERAWDRFVPFLAFPPDLRRVIYTTNAIESLNFQLRKVTKNRGHFPTDDAAVKLLWLAIRDIEGKRARERSKAPVRHRSPETAARAAQRAGHGTGTMGWTKALNALAMAYPDRIPTGAL
jgi:putative transposase